MESLEKESISFFFLLIEETAAHLRSTNENNNIREILLTYDFAAASVWLSVTNLVRKNTAQKYFSKK